MHPSCASWPKDKSDKSWRPGKTCTVLAVVVTDGIFNSPECVEGNVLLLGRVTLNHYENLYF